MFQVRGVTTESRAVTVARRSPYSGKRYEQRNLSELWGLWWIGVACLCKCTNKRQINAVIGNVVLGVTDQHAASSTVLIYFVVEIRSILNELWVADSKR